MLFVPITRPESLQHIPNQVDAVECRLDYDVSLKDHKCPKPVMFTVRSAAHGGKFRGTEEEREALIEELAALKPDYLDLEYDMRPDFLLKKWPCKIVLSYHNFVETPDLEPIYEKMSRYPAFTYKIACMARCTEDALRMLLFAKTHERVSMIAMGECGEFARVLGPVVGNVIDYASLDEATAPGQLSLQDLEIYRYRTLNPQTALYGLIGDPVSESQGHIYHNNAFARRGLNAVYVKMIVKDPSTFFPLANAFRGLSVTMPLKEKVMPFLDEVDPKALQIGAVNTIANGKGYNTDGVGALDAIGDVKDKRVVLLGAGGAARAIAFEAKARGAHVTILNRTVEKAKDLAKAVGCDYGSLAEVPSHYDILVNCSPDPMPIDPDTILPTAHVMDIVYVPRETEFLREAVRRGCKVIYGEEMFWNQAAAQLKLW